MEMLARDNNLNSRLSDITLRVSDLANRINSIAHDLRHGTAIQSDQQKLIDLRRRMNAEIDRIAAELVSQFPSEQEFEWVVELKVGGFLCGFASREEAQAWASEHPEEVEGVFRHQM